MKPPITIFIIIFLIIVTIDIYYAPRIELLKTGQVILWYNDHKGKGERTFKILFNIR